MRDSLSPPSAGRPQGRPYHMGPEGDGAAKGSSLSTVSPRFSRHSRPLGERVSPVAAPPPAFAGASPLPASGERGLGEDGAVLGGGGAAPAEDEDVAGLRLGCRNLDEMAAGTYSLCSIPITGDMNNSTFVQRIQENIPALKVVCTPVTIKAAPKQQAIVQELPSMSPL